MADEQQLKLLKLGVERWNEWREENPQVKIDLYRANLGGVNLGRANLNKADLRGANLHGANLEIANLGEANLGEAQLFHALLYKADLSKANLMRAYLGNAKLDDANLSGADLWDADLGGAQLDGAQLDGADLIKADFSYANLTNANLTNANLTGANLSRANLSYANLTGANFKNAKLISTNLVLAKVHAANISNSHVCGVNIWDLEGEFEEQKELIITPDNTSVITVDNIKVAQFIYLILNNKEVRDVVNTFTSKTVLILGRFALPERKLILNALRNKLREYDLLPIVFDLERPNDKDFTETIKTLAGMCYFVIADVTNPKSSPLELQATIPDYQIPFVPIIQEGEDPFAMMVDLHKKYDWVLDTITYKSADQISKILKKGIIDRAMQKHDELRLIKASVPTVISGSQFEE